MNEHLEAGLECFRIIKEFEKAPPKWPQTPDGAALLAYRCPSGQWTIGFGCCFWEDGTPVKEGDELFDVARIDAILDYNVRGAEAYVREHVRVPLNQYQFDALVSFRFNTRETTLRKSTRLLPAINAQEWDRAANAFSEFVYGSSKFNGKDYQEALRGLLRRRLCEALVFQGLDWTEAVKDNDVALPCDRILLASDIYRDKIRADGVTTLAHVRPVALNHPLPKPTTPAATPQATAKAGTPGDPTPQPRIPPASPAQNPAASTSSGPSRDVADKGVAPSAPVAPPPTIHPGNSPVPKVTFPKEEPKAKEPVVITPKSIDPNAINYGQVDIDKGAKNMTDSRRFVGLLVVGAGSLTQVVATRYAVTNVMAGVFYDLSRDPIIVSLVAAGVIWLIGSIGKFGGRKTTTKGFVEAEQVLK